MVKQIWVSALIASSTIAASASADIIAIDDPFAGDLSESWESFANSDDFGFYPSGTFCFGDVAHVWGNSLYVYEPGVADFIIAGQNAQAADGVRGLGVNTDSGYTEIAFDTPISAFGAFWGAGSSFIDVEFYGTDGAFLDSVSLGYDAVDMAGALEWHGWSSDVAIGRVAFFGDYVAIDGLQANLIPAPGAMFFLASAMVFASRRRRG